MSVALSHLAIQPARSAADLALARALVADYIAELGIDLSYQNVAAELAGLPGAYAPPAGEFLIASSGGAPAGCVAVRPCPGPPICEMKRLYVRPAYRAAGIGLRLAADIMAAARSLGYERMRLDTLASMVGALSIYRRLGFYEIPRYYDNPLSDVVYLEARL